MYLLVFVWFVLYICIAKTNAKSSQKQAVFGCINYRTASVEQNRTNTKFSKVLDSARRDLLFQEYSYSYIVGVVTHILVKMIRASSVERLKKEETTAISDLNVKMSNEKVLVNCYNRGCGQKFDPTENEDGNV